MRWIRLTNPTLAKIDAHWVAADVATRMKNGAAVVCRHDWGWSTWRSLDKDEACIEGFREHSELSAEVVATYPALEYFGRRIASLGRCQAARKVVEHATV